MNTLCETPARADSAQQTRNHPPRIFERNRQVIRQWELLLALQECPLSANDLAARLGVTPRTIYRDLAALEAARFPLYVEGDGGAGRWRLLSHSRVPARSEVRR